MRAQPLFAQALVVVLSLATVHSAWAQPAPTRLEMSDEAELARVASLFDAGKYAECNAELTKLLSPSDPQLEDADVVERARVYFAACLLAAGRSKEADEQLRVAIRENPQMRGPDRLMFPQEVVDRFIAVKDSMLEEIKQAEQIRLEKAKAAAEAAAKRRAKERERVQKLEAYAQRETEVTQNRRWLAAVPFGVGQFQNDDVALGFLFLGTEVALAGTALGAMIVELNLNARSDDPDAPVKDELNANLKTARSVLIFSSYGFLAVAAGGILEAQLSFEPEVRRTRTRSLPPELRGPSTRETSGWRPALVPLPQGLGLGAVGRF
ncbi:MAG: hypothetical protein R3B13_38330 [Polyangiaceae bacterium]